ncbi:MAG: hypothetical protein ACRC1D_03640 [Culicoidibacterales bacterium]
MKNVGVFGQSWAKLGKNRKKMGKNFCPFSKVSFFIKFFYNLFLNLGKKNAQLGRKKGNIEVQFSAWLCGFLLFGQLYI